MAMDGGTMGEKKATANLVSVDPFCALIGKDMPLYRCYMEDPPGCPRCGKPMQVASGPSQHADFQRVAIACDNDCDLMGAKLVLRSDDEGATLRAAVEHLYERPRSCRGDAPSPGKPVPTVGRYADVVPDGVRWPHGNDLPAEIKDAIRSYCCRDFPVEVRESPELPRLLETVSPQKCPRCDVAGVCDISKHDTFPTDIDHIRCRACKFAWAIPADSLETRPAKPPKCKAKPPERVAFNAKAFPDFPVEIGAESPLAKALATRCPACDLALKIDLYREPGSPLVSSVHAECPGCGISTRQDFAGGPAGIEATRKAIVGGLMVYHGNPDAVAKAPDTIAPALAAIEDWMARFMLAGEDREMMAAAEEKSDGPIVRNRDLAHELPSADRLGMACPGCRGNLATDIGMRADLQPGYTLSLKCDLCGLYGVRKLDPDGDPDAAIRSIGCDLTDRVGLGPIGPAEHHTFGGPCCTFDGSHFKYNFSPGARVAHAVASVTGGSATVGPGPDMLIGGRDGERAAKVEGVIRNDGPIAGADRRSVREYSADRIEKAFGGVLSIGPRPTRGEASESDPSPPKPPETWRDRPPLL